MIFTPLSLAGAWAIAPESRSDDRGFFARTFCRREFGEHGIDAEIVQCNVSHNRRRATLRGMHFQVAPRAEGKLVQCAAGAVYDVLLDLRPESPTFRQWEGHELSAENRRMLWIPEGFAHGFQTLRDDTDVLYFMTESFSPEHARGVRWDDPAFGISWPLRDPVLSERDRSYAPFAG